MANDLAAIVVRETDIKPARLDEAIERHVTGGGGLDTVLLEMELIDETRLLPLLAEAHSLPSVGREEILAIDPGVVEVFPQRLAEKHNIVPIELNGRRLSVAVTNQPDLGLLDEIGFMLSVYVRPFVTTEVRVAHALFQLYGIKPAPRLEHLLVTLGEEPLTAADDATVVEATVDDEQPASHASERANAVEAEASPVATLDGSSSGARATTHDDIATWRVEKSSLAVLTDEGVSSAEPARVPAQAVSMLLGGAGRLDEPVDEQPDQVETPESAAEKHDPVPVTERAVINNNEMANEVDVDKRRMERVRWTVDDAIAELAMADNREAIIDVMLRFAYRRLKTVAMFVLHRDRFNGWDIIDDELGRADIVEVSIPAAGEHLLAKLNDVRSPSIGPLLKDDPLAVALRRQPKAVLLVPVMVGDKLVAVLYGDCAQGPVPPTSLAELHMVAPRFGKALRKLILRQRQQEDRHASQSETSANAVSEPLESEVAPKSQPRVRLQVEPGAVSPEASATSNDASSTGSFEPLHEEAGAPGGSQADAEVREAASSEVQTPLEEGDLGTEETLSDASTQHGPEEHGDDDHDKDRSEVDAKASVTAPSLESHVDDDGIEEALGALTPASDGSFAQADAHTDAVTSVASVVGVTLDDPVDLSKDAGATFQSEEEIIAASQAEDEDEQKKQLEAEGLVLSSRLGAVAEEILDRSDEELTFQHACDEESDAENSPRGVTPSTERVSSPIPGTPLRNEPAVRPGPSTWRSAPARESEDNQTSRASTSAVNDDDGVLRRAGSGQLPEAAQEAGGSRTGGDSGSDAAHATAGAERDQSAEHLAERTASADMVASEQDELAIEKPVDDGGNRTQSEDAVSGSSDDDTGLPAELAKSPGADADEESLVAVWKAWLRHETPDIDDQLIDLQRAGEAGRAAVHKLVNQGDDVMPALSRYFPGTLETHPFSFMDIRPDVRDLSDALRCLIWLGPDRAAPILCAELNSPDRLHRYAAVWALSELHVPAALKRLTRRVFDPEYRVALLVLDVLPNYRNEPAFHDALKQLRLMAQNGDDFERKRAITALSELKDRDAVSHLIEQLNTRPKDLARETLRALINITKQDFRYSKRRWRSWLTQSGHKRRIEWMIDGLSHKSTDIRREAQIELNQLTGEYFGYRYDAPRAEREQTVQRWRTWWAAEADQAVYQ